MGDYVRWAAPHYEGADPSAGSALFLALNRNKRSIRLDLKQEGGREALLRLAESHDVLLESFRPGVLDRLGVGYEVLRERNPGLVYCAITGYGQDGPYRERSGHDMNYLGLVGLLGAQRRPRRPAGAGGRADRRPGRRGADGLLRDPGRPARARSLRAGAAGGRVDGRRRAVLAGHGGRALLLRRNVAAPRRPRAGGSADLLPALRVRRRLGHAGRAGAQVLAGLVSRGGARGPDREAVRGAGIAGPRRGRARCS